MMLSDNAIKYQMKTKPQSVVRPLSVSLNEITQETFSCLVPQRRKVCNDDEKFVSQSKCRSYSLWS